MDRLTVIGSEERLGIDVGDLALGQPFSEFREELWGGVTVHTVELNAKLSLVTVDVGRPVRR